MEGERRERAGVAYAVAAFAAWGILPLYWKALKVVPAEQILAHRIIWSFVFVGVLLTVQRRWNDLRTTLKSGKNRGAVVIGGIFISANWFIYIWAVNSGHVVEASLGYYINPLLTVVLGVIVLQERLNLGQQISFGLASIGVIILTIQYGRIPWIALLLAVTFALYGLVKKQTKLDSLIGLLLETLVVTPVALIYLISCHWADAGLFLNGTWHTTALLIGAGVVTATPLIWFAQAAKKIPLSTVGFAQYISPSLSLILGIFVFGENFTKYHFAGFSLIWLALVIFSCVDLPKKRRQSQDGIST